MKTAAQISTTAKAITNGILIGGALGLVLATITGSCRVCTIFWGAAIGGSSGYLIKSNSINSNDGK